MEQLNDGIHVVELYDITLADDWSLVFDFRNENGQATIFAEINESLLRLVRKMGHLSDLNINNDESVIISHLINRLFVIEIISGKVKFIRKHPQKPYREITIEVDTIPIRNKLKDKYFLHGFGYVGFVPDEWFIPFDYGFKDELKGKQKTYMHSIHLLILYFHYDKKYGEYNLSFSTKYFSNPLGLLKGINHIDLFKEVENGWSKKGNIPVNVHESEDSEYFDATFDFHFKERKFEGQFHENTGILYLTREYIPDSDLFNWSEIRFRAIALENID